MKQLNGRQEWSSHDQHVRGCIYSELSSDHCGSPTNRPPKKEKLVAKNTIFQLTSNNTLNITLDHSQENKKDSIPVYSET